MEKVVIVVKDGMVQSVYGKKPYNYDVEILDLDTRNPDEECIYLDRLQVIKQYLCKIY